MLKLRLITLLFLTVGIILYYYAPFGFQPINIILFCILGYLSVVAFFALNMGQNVFIDSIISGNTSEKVVAVTFDDGPHPKNTPIVLKILKEYGAKATFFCIGKNVDKYPEVLSQVFKDGHTIGNHSYSHSPKMAFWDSNSVKEELIKTNEKIKSVTNQIPKIYRPPFGVTNPSIAEGIRSSGLTSIGWNIRSFDTGIKNEKFLVKRVLNRLKPGGIILLHDVLDKQKTILPAILKGIKERGYRVVPLEEIFGDNK